MARRKGKMTEEEKKKLPEAFRANWKRSRNEVRMASQKGGEKSGEVRRAQRSMKDYFEMIADSPLLPSFEEVHKLWKLPDESKNNKMALAMAIWKAAMQGNMKAAELILRIMGEYEETNNLNVRQQFNRMVLGDDSFAQ